MTLTQWGTLCAEARTKGWIVESDRITNGTRNHGRWLAPPLCWVWVARIYGENYEPRLYAIPSEPGGDRGIQMHGYDPVDIVSMGPSKAEEVLYPVVTRMLVVDALTT